MRSRNPIAEKPIFDKGIANRFRVFRETYIHENQAQAAKEIPFNQGNLSMIEAGKRAVSYPLIKKLILKYHLNDKWLATGDGPKKIKPAPETGGLLGKSIKELTKSNEELLGRVILLEKAIRILEVNQSHFIKVIEKLSRNIAENHQESELHARSNRPKPTTENNK